MFFAHMCMHFCQVFRVELLGYTVCTLSTFCRLCLIVFRRSCFFSYIPQTLGICVLLAPTLRPLPSYKKLCYLNFMLPCYPIPSVPAIYLYHGQLDIPALSLMTWAFSSSLPLTDISYNFPRWRKCHVWNKCAQENDWSHGIKSTHLPGGK